MGRQQSGTLKARDTKQKGTHTPSKGLRKKGAGRAARKEGQRTGAPGGQYLHSQ